MEFLPLPFSDDFLEEYRLETRRKVRYNLIGGHITRRMGQSLEFREHLRYTMGDDVRHIDWRHTLRQGSGRVLPSSDKWLIRKYTADEHLKLLISIDNRATMTYPRVQGGRQRTGEAIPNISKLQMAYWLAAAISFLALRSDDKVTLHRLFGAGDDASLFVPIAGSRRSSVAALSDRIEHVLAKIDETDTPSLDELDLHLPPAAVWLIITDLYFDLDRVRPLIDRIASAQDGMRWIILIHLDSWPYERHILQTGARRIEGPGVDEPRRVIVSNPKVAQVEQRIRKHEQQFLESFTIQLDIDTIRWPGDSALLKEDNFSALLLEHFDKNDSNIRRLFMRDSWL